MPPGVMASIRRTSPAGHGPPPAEQRMTRGGDPGPVRSLRRVPRGAGQPGSAGIHRPESGRPVLAGGVLDAVVIVVPVQYQRRREERDDSSCLRECGLSLPEAFGQGGCESGLDGRLGIGQPLEIPAGQLEERAGFGAGDGDQAGVAVAASQVAGGELAEMVTGAEGADVPLTRRVLGYGGVVTGRGPGRRVAASSRSVRCRRQAHRPGRGHSGLFRI